VWVVLLISAAWTFTFGGRGAVERLLDGRQALGVMVLLCAVRVRLRRRRLVMVVGART
jgi:hypothetical protein